MEVINTEKESNKISKLSDESGTKEVTKSKRGLIKSNPRKKFQEKYAQEAGDVNVNKSVEEAQTHNFNNEKGLQNFFSLNNNNAVPLFNRDINPLMNDLASVGGDNLPLVIVKFEINSETFATAFKRTTAIKEIKDSLIDVLDLDEDIIILVKGDEEVEPFLTLADFGATNFSKITFKIRSSQGEKGEAVITSKVRENIPSLDVMTVHLGEAGDYRDIVVEIENRNCQKEWLGGYRHRLTNVEYHNAVAQTQPKKRKVFEQAESGDVIPLLYHRDTQTPFKPKDTSVDTVANKATQMWKADLYITSKTDKIMTSRPYTDYDQWYEENNNLKAVIIIQRAVKNWLHGQKIRNLISLQRTLINDLKKQREEILKEQADKERLIIIGAAYPVKRDDFYMLYLMVDNWWKREWKRICDTRSDVPKLAESVVLLEKEVQLLQNIEKHRIVSKEESLKKERMRFLEQTSRPKTFKNARGRFTLVDDLDTQRARQFKEIYSALTRKDLSPKERIDMLLNFKQLFVTQFMEYPYANDLISLIDREIDLLAIGTKMGDLIGLRKRIEQLYMDFLQQDKFNPKAAKYIKPNLPKTMNILFRCSRCLKLLPTSKYPVHVRMTSYSVCKSCTWLQNIGHQRKDMSPYLKLLKDVQNSEMEKCCYSAVCFILQPIGMGYLTNIIWHGRSIISECSDMSKLQHIRWLHDVEWAPWNTILLTNQEARCHISIPDVLEFYGKSLIEKIQQKHILARIMFIPLLKMDHDVRSSGVWSSVTDSGKYLHPSHAEVFASTDKRHRF